MARREPPPLEAPAEPRIPGEPDRARPYSPKDSSGWSWLPPFGPTEETVIRVAIGIGALAIGVLGLGLALGDLRALVAGPLGVASRVLLGAIGIFFAAAAVQSFLDGPPRPHARWRRVLLRANRRVEIGAMVLAALAGALLALRWLD